MKRCRKVGNGSDRILEALPGRCVNQIAGSVTLASIGCTLKLAEVYDRVDFPEPEEQTVQ